MTIHDIRGRTKMQNEGVWTLVWGSSLRSHPIPEWNSNETIVWVFFLGGLLVVTFSNKSITMKHPVKAPVGFLVLFAILSANTFGQSVSSIKQSPPIYVDKNGVMRWTANDKEAAFFGVNYTTPFAYAYRAHKALGVDLEKAIQQDVYHMARLGLDAFRVHVWDTEISDATGNLLDNDHLRLFDFLLAELKKRNIKTLITPIAFWGNGYPERDELTPGFSRMFGRGKLTTNDSAIVAQENYLKQFFAHVNPYTKLSYQQDPDVVAMEINNEPSHSGPKVGVTQYINRLAAAVKGTGWLKPVFYNISQGPYYADAVAGSVVDGFSFQWYPSGLVSGGTLKGNYLPHVDKYPIPFDTIPAFRKKALMVYEFDAADIAQPVMYPFMAKSFREAGFQWATQFAYDPLALAYANTEYQTHYLNLAYTPSKSISLMIASKVFHNVPRLKNFGCYPADSVFDVFRVSYNESLCEMNTEEEFYYSNSTQTKPANVVKLQHLAGVGSSLVVEYAGSGAYFLDRLEHGVWRLEVMPDAISIGDPFEKASPKKEVTRIQWQANRMKIKFSDLSASFTVSALNEGNSYSVTSDSNGFLIVPGTYLLIGDGKKFSGRIDQVGPIKLNEFVAPKSVHTGLQLWHEPLTEVSSGKSFKVAAKVAGLDSGTATLQINRLLGQSKNIPMIRKNAGEIEAQVPVDLAMPGLLTYKIILKKGTEISTFPGNFKSDPFAWDNYQSETWKTFVADQNSELEIYDPTADRTARAYPPFRKGFQTSYITDAKSGQLILRMNANEFGDAKVMGFQFSFSEKLIGRKQELGSYRNLVVRARTTDATPTKAKVTLIGRDASAWSTTISLSGEFRDIEIPLSNLRADSALLMPRPYPGFLPLFFKGSDSGKNFSVLDSEKIDVTIGSGMAASELKKPYILDVERIWLKKD
jgi:hypothetical protein